LLVCATAIDGLPSTTEANITRNQELADKYESVLAERQRVVAEGIMTFADLMARYQSLFVEAAAS